MCCLWPGMPASPIHWAPWQTACCEIIMWCKTLWFNDRFIIIRPSFVRECSFQRASFPGRSIHHRPGGFAVWQSTACVCASGLRLLAQWPGRAARACEWKGHPLWATLLLWFSPTYFPMIPEIQAWAQLANHLCKLFGQICWWSRVSLSVSFSSSKNLREAIKVLGSSWQARSGTQWWGENSVFTCL